MPGDQFSDIRTFSFHNKPFLKWQTLSLLGDERETKARSEEEKSLSTMVTSLNDLILVSFVRK